MSIESRKIDHLRLAAQLTQNERSGFDDIRFIHRSFPEIAFDDICLQTEIAGLHMDVPIWMNAMTGGSGPSHEINRDLAIVARELGLAMAVGSQRAALQKEELSDSYTIVRKMNPDGIVIANLSAGASLDDVLRAIDMLNAQWLQLHINVPQELVMPEGDRDFRGILTAVEQVVLHSPVPVIVKEVGFGMCAETYHQLQQIGVKIVDVSGRGGTNFIAVENERRHDWKFDDLHDWGQTTVVSLLESKNWQDRLTVLASGGVRNPLDVLKCLALGARAVGLAGPILRTYNSLGRDGLLDVLKKWIHELRLVMTLLGCKTIQDLSRTSFLVTGESADWCEARGISLKHFTRG